MTQAPSQPWQHRIFLGGWTPGHGDTVPVIEPATGDHIAELATASAEDVDAAARMAGEGEGALESETPAPKPRRSARR